MKHFGIALLTGIIGYVIVAFLSYFLIGKFSSNGHDRSVEASMTCLFVYGPIGLILSFIAGYIWAKALFNLSWLLDPARMLVDSLFQLIARDARKETILF